MKAFQIILVLILLPACGASVGNKSSVSTAAATSSSNADFRVQQLYPLEDTVSSLPATVTVTYNKSSLSYGSEAGSVALASNYLFSCGNTSYEPTAVGYTYGYSSAIVTLPIISNLSSGSTCVFTVSSNMRDGSGNYIQGARSVSYVIAASSTTWSPSSSATYTYAAGGSG